MAVGRALDGGSIGPEELTPPPSARGALFRHRGKPVLPEDGTKIPWRGASERIASEELQDVGVVNEEEFLSARHDGVLRPCAEGGEPEVPVETRLVGCVNSRRL